MKTDFTGKSKLYQPEVASSPVWSKAFFSSSPTSVWNVQLRFLPSWIISRFFFFCSNNKFAFLVFFWKKYSPPKLRVILKK
jgi:hypothetical protein